MAVTMKDVATYAGISIGTVSNYITGKAPVSPKKQQQIQNAIDALGYRVNIAGRNLRKHSFETVGLLIPHLKNTYLLRVASVMEELLRQHGYNIMISSYHGAVEKEREMFYSMSQRVDAIIYVPSLTTTAWIREVRQMQEKLPIVIFNEALAEECCDCVLVDSRKATKSTVSALLDRGHKKIGVIMGLEQMYTTQQRLLGYKEAYEEAGLPVDTSLILYGDYSRNVGAQLCRELLQQNSDVSAIVVIAYRMTLGAISTLNQCGLREKIPVIGYDASDLDDVLTPGIGYVYQPYDQVAQTVVDLVLRRIRKDLRDYPTTILLEAEIRGLDALDRK